jgi:hypothetical protein
MWRAVVRHSIASTERWPISPPGGVSETAAPGDARTVVRRILGLVDDAEFLLMAVWLFPAAVLVVGIPLALLVRLLLEMADRI